MKKLIAWAADSYTRIYKSTHSNNCSLIKLNMGLDDRSSFQVGFRAEGFSSDVRLSLNGSKELSIRIRETGYVYLDKLNTDTPETEQDGVGEVPGFVPDPLFEIKDNTIKCYPMESGSLWVSIKSSSSTTPGVYKISVTLDAGCDNSQTVSCEVEVFPVLIKPADFPWCAHWFYPNCIYEWHGLKPFEEKTWQLVEKYMQNLWDHGNNILNTFLHTMPVNGNMGYYQLLKVKKTDGENYEFDWSLVRRWIRMAKKIGFKMFLWPHFFSQWGAKNPPVIYENMDDPNQYDGKNLWPAETPGTHQCYRNYLSRMLPELKKILEEEEIFDGSMFHLSDEPLDQEEHLANYRNGRDMILEIAPWIRCMDAINHVEYAKEGMTDIPIAGLTVSSEFRKNKIPHFSYFCCGPRGTWLNRLMDTPLVKIRATAWLTYALESKGIMHWGYNYWYKLCKDVLINPYVVTHGHDYPMIPHGDCYVVYPGDEGPVDSIRWEVFAQSMWDCALLSARNIPVDHHVLSNNIKDYNIFPKHSDWYEGYRELLLKGMM